MVTKLQTVYDVRMLLKRFGTFIYSRDRIGDLLLMESELEELHRLQLISQDEYITGKLILQKERIQTEQNERRQEHE